MTSSPPTESLTTPAWWISGLQSIAIVLPASFIAGAATSLAQTVLPDAIRSLANSSGGWSMIVMTLVWAARCRPWLGIVLAVASFYLLNAGYAAMSAIRGVTWQLGLDNFFVVVGFLVGPFVGLAAVWMRARSPWLVAVASALLPAILIGEGIYGLTVIADSTSPVYWWLSISVGTVFLAVMGWTRLRTIAPIALSVVLASIGVAVLLGGLSMFNS